MTETAKSLRIFLSYAHADVVAVRKLHKYLREKGFDVWFDKDSLLPGHDWQLEIEKGLNSSDVVIICLSQIAVSKEGFVQREFKFALDRTLDMPDGRIFLIPVRLQACEVPTRLSRYHWVDLFERDGYSRLMRSLKMRAEQLARANVEEMQPVNIPEPDERLDNSLSVGQNVSGSALVVGDNNVIYMAPISTAQDEAAKREKQREEDERQKLEKAEAEEKIKEQERIAAEEAENEGLEKIKVENEIIAKDKAEKVRLAQEKAEAERIVQEQVERERMAAENTEKEWLAKVETKYEGKAVNNQNVTDAPTTPKTTIQFFVVLFLLIVGCLVILLLGQIPPAKPIPSATPQTFATTTLPPATNTAMALSTNTHTVPPIDIPIESTLVAGDTQVSPIDGMVLHYISAGPFTMGSDNSEVDEKPAHLVTLDAFWIDETEVTNTMYKKCVTAKKCSQPKDIKHFLDSNYANHPVVYVSGSDAIAYCIWAGRTLPSEAQWEKAARGTDEQIYPWGNDVPSIALLNYNMEIGDTTEVGHYPSGKSPYGAYDMAGNVWEWVNDWYDAYPGGDPDAIYAFGKNSSILRGGSQGSNADSIRTTERYGIDLDYKSGGVGFRCAISQ